MQRYDLHPVLNLVQRPNPAQGRAELAALHAEYEKSGARILNPPTDEPWGMREMLVADLDGNTFRMGVPAGEG